MKSIQIRFNYRNKLAISSYHGRLETRRALFSAMQRRSAPHCYAQLEMCSVGLSGHACAKQSTLNRIVLNHRQSLLSLVIHLNHIYYYLNTHGLCLQWKSALPDKSVEQLSVNVRISPRDCLRLVRPHTQCYTAALSPLNRTNKI